VDPRAKHLNRLRRLRRSARRWSVAAASFTGAAIVLLPYHGLGIADAFWAAAAGGTAAVTWWRWSDLREFAAMPVPEPLDPAQRAAATQRRIEAFVGRLPVGRRAISEAHRVAHMSRLRGSSVAEAGARLDRAMRTLAALAPRLTGHGSEVLLEAAVAEEALRDLAERTASVERAVKIAAPNDPSRDQLVASHAALLDHFTTGVGAYESLVAAAGTFVAETGRIGEPVAIGRLVEATDRVRGIAMGISELSFRTQELPETS
jgi:hypothetical protein